MWKDPNSPKWTEDIKFPVGSLIFKLLFTDATDLEVPSMVGAPGWDAVSHSTCLKLINPVLNLLIQKVIAVQSDNPDPSIRNKLPRTVRILQMDIATRDDRSLTGWIFGTFMYNGHLKQHDVGKHLFMLSGALLIYLNSHGTDSYPLGCSGEMIRK